ncbi:hypothetical protein SAMN04488038_101393 [Solimonas aquatica]|uniref:Uncharacterized protein n=1 Tax=Solimonas aquatica TaxID=489703 RepID=A0A1H9AFV7_9GAMM|nr:hypothetical protein [Solimonas aquatica]SEP75672.1 hypothetical protein SAMN04488038_101393 [Solimonas aquatica]
MASPLAAIASADAAPRVNASARGSWVLDPAQDLLFVILAPLLVLVLAIAAFRTLGAVQATALVLGTHIVMTVAHHLPTFIRIYMDVQLFARHRWTFLLAPLLPFGITLAAGGWLLAHRLPAENLLYLFLLAVLWDPWHFLMQHYGFMRIYDRANQAPHRLAARMDLALCASCFIAIMLASSEWLAGLLEDLHRSVAFPAGLIPPPALLATLRELALLLALGTLMIYALYLLWCLQQRYVLSLRKLALFGCSFAAMALAYTPNAWITQLAPGWTFKVGFAAIGIVHMTQYLAIVWRYNRGLTARSGRARGGWFTRLHARGGLLIAGAYVLLCLGYGQTVSSQWRSDALMVLLIALGLTSTLMHYYFDGFIWKLRQPANAQVLDLPARETPAAPGTAAGPGRVFARQLLYFGLPLALLSSGAWAVWHRDSAAGYVGHLLRANVLSQQGDATGAAQEAMAAYAEMQSQLPFEQSMTQIHPSAARETSLAMLVYNHARFAHLLLPSLQGHAPDTADRAAYAQATVQAATLLERALERAEPLGDAGGAPMRREDAQRLLQSWRAELQALHAH